MEVNGFQQFCKAVSHLYAAAMSFNPGLEELTRLRIRTGTARNLYGETDIPGLFRLHLAGSLHAQLPTTWQHLVSAFYGRAFAVFYHRVEAGGEVGLEDSADWTGDLICRGCDQQTDTCCCKQVCLLNLESICNLLAGHFKLPHSNGKAWTAGPGGEVVRGHGC